MSNDIIASFITSCDYILYIRSFWAFDSFRGLPKLRKFDKIGPLAKGRGGKFRSSQEEYLSNLQDYGAYDPDIVTVSEGFFRDTLPNTNITRIAFVRLDGKLYESTMDSLNYLYDKIVPRGYIYVNDYNAYNGCKLAVDKFRRERNITEKTILHEIDDVDWRGNAVREAVWWQKEEAL